MLEASSHGLAQHRLDGVTVGAGAFTNLSRDHLDYHGSMDDYRDAKLRLFSELLPEGSTAVLNADSEDFEVFASVCEQHGCQMIDFGVQANSLCIQSLEPSADGQLLSLRAFGNSHQIELPLPGTFQASNALCAAGLAIALGDDPDAVIAALVGIESVPGRRSCPRSGPLVKEQSAKRGR